MCDNCDVLQERIDDLEHQIEEYEDALHRIRAFCDRVVARAAPIVSQPSGVPRGKWIYARGSGGVAAKVRGMIPL